jgi:hypothetical protein
MAQFVYDDMADVWGDAQIYKGIKIYPLLVEDIKVLSDGIGYLTVYKNRSFFKDNFAKMGYLQFLMKCILPHMAHYAKSKEPDTFLSFLQRVCRDVKSIEIKNDGKNFYLLFDGEIQIFNSGFDQIRKIIFRQNKIDFDENMSESFANNLEKARTILEKRNKAQATFQEQIISYHCTTHVSYSDIRKLTIWQFRQGYNRISMIKQFEAFAALVAECGKKGTKIPGWDDPMNEKPWYESLLTNMDDIQNIN